MGDRIDDVGTQLHIGMARGERMEFPFLSVR
jgi:hypothetical protein